MRPAATDCHISSADINFPADSSISSCLTSRPRSCPCHDGDPPEETAVLLDSCARRSVFCRLPTSTESRPRFEAATTEAATRGAATRRVVIRRAVARRSGLWRRQHQFHMQELSYVLNIVSRCDPLTSRNHRRCGRAACSNWNRPPGSRRAAPRIRMQRTRASDQQDPRWVETSSCHSCSSCCPPCRYPDFRPLFRRQRLYR